MERLWQRNMQVGMAASSMAGANVYMHLNQHGWRQCMYAPQSTCIPWLTPLRSQHATRLCTS